MRKALLVARWEFLNTVMRRAYVFAVVAMPAIFIGIGAITVLTTPRSITAAVSAPVALVDKAHIVDLAFAAEQAARRESLRTTGTDPLPSVPGVTSSVKFVPYDDTDRALADLKDQKVSAVYVVEPDYVSTGNIVAYSREASIFNQAAGNQRQTQVSDAIRASLLRDKVPDDVLARAFAPAVRLQRFTMDASGTIADGASGFGFGRFAGTFGVFILLTMSIFFSAGFLQQATVEDRQNRVFEILLSSIDADSLILGKIAGLGGAGLLQVGIYIAFMFAASTTVMPLFDVSVGQLLLSLVYCVIGYLLFASFMAAIGMISRSAQESAQLSAWWTLAASAPMFFLPAIGSAPNGLMARVMSFFPLTSPVTMLLRLSTATVPTVDIVLTILIGIASVYAALRGTVKIFRAATLMYGKRPNLPELMRWLRAT